MTDLSPEKASRRATEITKLKNRKRYLEAVIERSTKELQIVNTKLKEM